MAPVSEDVKLLGTWASPFAMRARMALNIKGVDYEFLQENLASKSELLLKSNPVYKKVPVLIHGENSICESLVILQYIDEAWSSGPPILPSDPYDRALARFWASFVDEKWFPPTRAIILTDGEESKKKIEEASEALDLLESAFIKISKGHSFFGGEKIGFLDIVIGSSLSWVKVINEMAGIDMMNENRTPNLFRWARHFTSNPAVQGLLPETDKLMEFAKFLVSKYKVPAKN